MRGSILFVELGIDATNDDIFDQMRTMKACREDGSYRNIVCTVRGFSDDERMLFEIPEVRAFCRRVVNLGFISYLDFTTTFDSGSPQLLGKRDVVVGWVKRTRADPPSPRDDLALDPGACSCVGWWVSASTLDPPYNPTIPNFCGEPDSSVPAIAKDGWGAAEVWLCGEGRLRSHMPLTRELIDELKLVVCESNEKADAAIGPMQ